MNGNQNACPTDGAIPFATAWLRYWRDIGNEVIATPEDFGFYITEMPGLRLQTGVASNVEAVPQPELEPHERPWTGDMHSGASRAMLRLLDMYPDGKAAVRAIVGARRTPA